MRTKILRSVAAAAIFSFFSNVTLAEAVTYVIDSSHTFPAFEADHAGGLSLWRGKINSSSGTVILDKVAETGSVDVEMDITTIDFGFEPMNESALDHIFNVKDYPTATYRGTLTNFESGAPTAVEGVLTLNGVSKDVTLDINKFQCQPHFRSKREVCGADASADINRGDYDIVYGLDAGFFPEVKLLISIEAQIPAP